MIGPDCCIKLESEGGRDYLNFTYWGTGGSVVKYLVLL